MHRDQLADLTRCALKLVRDNTIDLPSAGCTVQADAYTSVLPTPAAPPHDLVPGRR